MSLPVYIIHWNQPQWCTSSVASLEQSDIPVVVTVIDNSCNYDGTARRIITGGNIGYTGAANLALREWLEGDCRYCVIGSHDLHVESDTLGRLISAADQHPGVGICGPNLSPGGFGDEVAKPVGDLEFRTWISGSCLLLRRECVLEIGYFDEDFGSYVEDVDLCFRALDQGWSVARVMSAKARGLGHGSESSLRMVHANWILLSYKRGRYRGLMTELIYVFYLAVRHSLLSVSLTSGRWVHRQKARRAWGGLFLGFKKACVAISNRSYQTRRGNG